MHNMDLKRLITPTVKKVLVGLTVTIGTAFIFSKAGFGFPLSFYAFGWVGLGPGYTKIHFLIVDILYGYLLGGLLLYSKKGILIALAVLVLTVFTAQTFHQKQIDEDSMRWRNDLYGKLQVEQCERDGGKWIGLTCLYPEN